MASLMIGLVRFWFAIRMALRDPAFRLLLGLTAGLLLIGTWVFHHVEGWSYLDSFYFSAITLTTVGYGDFAPTTPAGKLLTVLYVFVGIGLLVAFLSLFANNLIQSVMENREKLHGQVAGIHGKLHQSDADAVQSTTPDEKKS